jgi:hypothetical protein
MLPWRLILNDWRVRVSISTPEIAVGVGVEDTIVRLLVETRTPVPTKNLIPMTEMKNRGMIRSNDRDLDTAPVPPRLAL